MDSRSVVFTHGVSHKRRCENTMWFYNNYHLTQIIIICMSDGFTFWDMEIYLQLNTNKVLFYFPGDVRMQIKKIMLKSFLKAHKWLYQHKPLKITRNVYNVCKQTLRLYPTILRFAYIFDMVPVITLRNNLFSQIK